MDMTEYIFRIAELNCSALLKVSSADYVAALIDLADAYALERIVISHVQLLRGSTCKAQGPAGENSG